MHIPLLYTASTYSILCKVNLSFAYQTIHFHVEMVKVNNQSCMRRTFHKVRRYLVAKDRQHLPHRAMWLPTYSGHSFVILQIRNRALRLWNRKEYICLNTKLKKRKQVYNLIPRCIDFGGLRIHRIYLIDPSLLVFLWC